LRVREADSNPSVIASELVFPNATLSVAGSAVTVQGLVVDGDKGDITVSASGATWTIDNDAPSIANKVVGPASSTDNAVARFDATTGKLLQNSDVIITDDGFVGIGTASPDRKLVIDGSTGSPGLSVRHTARSGGGLNISSGNNRSSIFNSDALPLRLGVVDTTAINISSTNEVTFPVGVALGTPLSGVATNLTGTASGLTAGTVTTNANLTGHVTSVGNAAVLGSFTKSQLDAAVSDGNVLYVGDAPTAHNHAATEITSGTLPVARLSFTKAELDTAVSDGNVLYVGDVTSNATHSGDVTGDTVLTIANAAVTLAKMANLAQDQFIGRTTASTGVPETATITAAARTVLDDATVADMVNTLGGATSTGTGALVRATSPTLTGTLTTASLTVNGTLTLGSAGVVPSAGTTFTSAAYASFLFTAGSSAHGSSNIFNAGTTSSVIGSYGQSEGGTLWGLTRSGYAAFGAFAGTGTIVGSVGTTRYHASSHVFRNEVNTADGAITCGNLTASGTISSTANGAASTPASTLVGTWFTGGSATTTKPQLLVEPTGTTSTGWSTSGTGIGVNAASGFTGNLLDLKTAGTSRITISATGDINAWNSNVSQRFGSNFYFFNGSFNSTSGCNINAGGSGNPNLALNSGGSAVSVVMQPKAAQTGDILQIQNASAAVLCKVDVSGNLTASGTGTFSSTGSHTFGTTNTVTMTAGALVASASIRVGGGTVVANILSATATLDFGSIGSNATETLTITVTGAVAGDSVFLGCPAGLDAGLVFCASVTAADTVTVRMHNSTGGAVDPASATFRATVIRF